MDPVPVSTPSARILVVEDEPDISGVLQHVLNEAGFKVRAVTTGREAIDACEEQRPDLMLLDLMLPDFSGYEVLKHLRRSRENAQIRVVVLTARSDELDRVLGFEFGADDYVTKPFSPRELVLRIRSVLKRGVAEAGDSPGHSLSHGPIEIDLDNHQVEVAGRLLELTPTEFKLLADLVRARGRVRTREALLSELWDYDAEVMSRTVDTHVRRLRTKLGEAADWIRTVRGVGYRLQRPADRD